MTQGRKHALLSPSSSPNKSFHKAFRTLVRKNKERNFFDAKIAEV